MTGDLHTHTHFSDGSMSVKELVRYAKASGLSAVAVTDHDTLMTKEEARALSDDSITVIGGAEFSALDPDTGRKVHLLCYYPENEDKLLAHCRKIQDFRDEAGVKMAVAVSKLYPVTLEEITAYKGVSKSIFKQHIMHALVERGFTHEFYGDVYKSLFGKNSKIYEAVPYPDVYEMIDLIKECKGICVLAHPYVYNSLELAEKLAKDHIVDGIEVYHYSADDEQSEILKKLCVENGLIITGGSDFHGLYSSTCRTIGHCVTNEEQLQKIMKVNNNGH